MSSAVLFLIFNRPDTTSRVFEAIRVARPPRLYVAADGPRPHRRGEAERCAQARRIATAVDWPCEVRTLFRDENLGCRRAVSGAISWFFGLEDAGIILEDDCLPDPSFFPFCTELLARHRDDPQVMCITGNNFQADMRGWPHSYYFSIYNHCWGWASWRRAWALHDADLAGFNPADAWRRLRRLSRVPGFTGYFLRQINRVHRGTLDSWAFAWTWTCWRQHGLTCTPRVNLVSNIGFGPEATHTNAAASGAADLPRQAIAFPLSHPKVFAAEPDFDDFVSRRHFRVQNHTLIRRLHGWAGRCLRATGHGSS